MYGYMVVWYEKGEGSGSGSRTRCDVMYACVVTIPIAATLQFNIWGKFPRQKGVSSSAKKEP